MAVSGGGFYDKGSFCWKSQIDGTIPISDLHTALAEALCRNADIGIFVRDAAIVRGVVHNDILKGGADVHRPSNTIEAHAAGTGPQTESSADILGADPIGIRVDLDISLDILQSKGCMAAVDPDVGGDSGNVSAGIARREFQTVL